jgi:hypothetical protein
LAGLLLLLLLLHILVVELLQILQQGAQLVHLRTIPLPPPDVDAFDEIDFLFFSIFF